MCCTVYQGHCAGSDLNIFACVITRIWVDNQITTHQTLRNRLVPPSYCAMASAPWHNDSRRRYIHKLKTAGLSEVDEDAVLKLSCRFETVDPRVFEKRLVRAFKWF